MNNYPMRVYKVRDIMESNPLMTLLLKEVVDIRDYEDNPLDILYHVNYNKTSFGRGLYNFLKYGDLDTFISFNGLEFEDVKIVEQEEDEYGEYEYVVFKMCNRYYYFYIDIDSYQYRSYASIFESLTEVLYEPSQHFEYVAI